MTRIQKKKYPAYWLGEALKDIIIEIWPKALIVGLNPKAKKKNVFVKKTELLSTYV